MFYIYDQDNASIEKIRYLSICICFEQLAGLLMLAFGIVAIVKPDYILVILGNIPGMDKIPAAFDLGGIITGSAIFMIVLGAVVGAVGFFGCCGACCESKGLLTGVSVHL